MTEKQRKKREYWLNLMEETLNLPEEVSVKPYLKSRGVSPSLYYYWMHKFINECEIDVEYIPILRKLKRDEKCREMIDSGVSPTDIARSMPISRRAVYAIINKERGYMKNAKLT